ncbi:hypothetical protein D3C79_913590 [compost metagenome]
MFPAARPSRDHRRQHIQGPWLLTAQVQLTRKLIGKHLPTPVQAPAGALHEVLPGQLIRLGQPAFGVIDDADGRIAIADDVRHAANGLVPLGRILRQQSRCGKGEPEVDQDRRALGQDSAIG